jgi:AcrR family transcriptional regulator
MARAAKKPPTAAAIGTRERILDAAAALFNAQRYGNVTTAMLAKAAGLSEGNLWYHFPEKRAILDAISERFLVQCARRLTIVPKRENVLAQYADYLHVLAEEIRDFQFMYRDQADYGEHSAVILATLPTTYRETIGQFRRFLDAMRLEKHLDLARDKIEPLAVNIVIVLRFYMEFAREAGLPPLGAGELIAQSFASHLSLFEGALTREARAFLAKRLEAEAA